MKTRDTQYTEGIQDTNMSGTPNSAPRRRRKASWLAGLGAFLVVIIIVGVSAVVFAQARQHATNGSNQSSLTPTGVWKLALQGYAVNSLAASRSNPATLYACALRGQSGQGVSSGVPAQGAPTAGQQFVVLRSTDSGAHWQNISANIAPGYTCQVAVNPTSANDVYIAGTSTGAQSSGVLYHSTDGGQTWTTITPTLSIPSAQQTPTWDVQQITIEGSHLFGIQYAQTLASQQGLPKGLPQPRETNLPRLVTSVDGGHTWTIVDTKLASTNLGVRGYAVDPANITTIYVLLGPAFGPIQPRMGAPTGSGVASTINSALYKTTDDGTTWKLLLNNLPFGSQLHLAANNPDLLYVGGSRIPLPYVAQSPRTGTEPAFNVNVANFHLRMSSDGGASWHDVPGLSQSAIVVNWFVSDNGQVFVYTVGETSGGSSGTPATAVPATPHTAPGASSSTHSTTSITGVISVTTSSSLSSSYITTRTGQPVATIQRYDPTSNAWSALPKLPVYGILLAVTPSSTSGNSVIWLLGDSSGKPALYQYVA